MSERKFWILTFIFSFLITFPLFTCKKEIPLEVPVIEGAYSIKKFSLDNGIKGMKFKIKAEYHSLKVLNYYDNLLKSKGYIPFIESYFAKWDRKWVGDFDLSKNRQHKLTAHWVDKEKTKRIILIIDINLKANISLTELENIEQIVTYQENPYFELPPPY
jgi:hypothetical protein